MLIGQRLREIRDANLSQDDIEKATGLVRPYISRVENGHTVPSIETLRKWAAALGMQLCQVLYTNFSLWADDELRDTVEHEACHIATWGAEQDDQGPRWQACMSRIKVQSDHMHN